MLWKSMTGNATNGKAGMAPNVLILTVNFNAWDRTLAYLESVLRLDYPSFRVVVVDNGSSDGSIERIHGWARGKQAADIPPGAPGERLRPPLPKPLDIVHLDQANPLTGARLGLLELGENRGFAGGNNAVLRHVQGRQDVDFVWLLNNDTIVDSRALTHLVARLENDPEAGMAGSTVCRLARPDETQAQGGGTFFPWAGYSRLLGEGSTLAETSQQDPAAIEARLHFILGASCLVRRSFVERVGLLDESLFLYFEELDWARRGSAFRLAYAPESLVWHAEGASIGANNLRPGEKSALADFYFHRNRLLMVRRYYPWALPTALFSVGATLARRLLRGRQDRLPVVFKAVRDALRDRRTRP